MFFAFTLTIFCPFWHINTYLYICTSSAISSHIPIIVDLLEAKLGNSHILPAFRKWVYGNAPVTCKWGFSFDIFLLRPKRFLFADSVFVGRRGPCFIHVISFHYISFLRVDQFRRLCLILLDPRYVFSRENLEGKGGGGTKSSLNSLVKTFISSIRCFCWSVSSELLSLSFRLTLSLFSF